MTLVRIQARQPATFESISHVSSNLQHQSCVKHSVKQHASASCIIDQFIASRRDGLSKLTIQSYREVFKRSIEVIGIEVTGQDIQRFLTSKQCTSGGKHGYYRVLRAFYNWLYSPKSCYGLQLQDNPILFVDAPKVEKKILPSLSLEQVDQVIDSASCIRDKAIISLFADSGLRLNEVANVDVRNID